MERAVHGKAGDSRTRAIVTTALLAALTCVGTLVLRVPSPTGGYMNLGDAVVMLGAFLLGPAWGAAAGGIGAAMADLLAGYAVYVPGTLVIKAVMGVTAGLAYRTAWGRRGGGLPAAVLGEIPMAAGYWLYDAILLHSLTGGAAGIPGNLVQAAFGIAAGVLLAAALRKNAYVRRSFPDL